MLTLMAGDQTNIYIEVESRGMTLLGSRITNTFLSS